jgi:hypothetical protein
MAKLNPTRLSKVHPLSSRIPETQGARDVAKIKKAPVRDLIDPRNFMP